MKRRAARIGDPEFGPVCGCGGAKAKQAWTCQPCHSRLRGYRTVPPSEQNRRWRRAWLGQPPGPIGDSDAALVAQAAALAQARQATSGELALLAAAQERDERLGHRAGFRWMLPLDATDRLGRPLYDLIAA